MAKILLVDDEDIFCNLMQGMLSSHGHEVITAYNGREGIDAFRQHRPQITVLDLAMPEMNGIEALRQIRVIDPEAVVMILTAMGTDELEQQARQLGAVDFLNKQMVYDEIVAAVESFAKAPDPGFVPGSVLLVDDSARARDVLEPFLRQNDIAVQLVTDGPGALALVEEARPQLVVLNMDLGGVEDPGNIGPNPAAVQFLEGLSRVQYPGGLFLMTFMAAKTYNVRALNLAHDASYLHKPVTPARLLVAIQTSLGITHKPDPPPPGKA